MTSSVNIKIPPIGGVMLSRSKRSTITNTILYTERQSAMFIVSSCSNEHKTSDFTSHHTSQKPLLLDLFCGAGGAGQGYSLAGFTVIGVDIEPQPRNPHEFYQDDALHVLDVLLDGKEWHGYHLQDFSVIHASPPCQSYSRAQHIAKVSAHDYQPAPKLIQPVRERLMATDLPWIIENVEGAELPDALELCGSMFGLPIRRHRWFSSSQLLFAPATCKHAAGFYNPVGGKVRGYGAFRNPTRFYVDNKGRTRQAEGTYTLAVGAQAMGIDWMTLAELSQAIPPAYTQFIGRLLLAAIKQEVVAQ